MSTGVSRIEQARAVLEGIDRQSRQQFLSDLKAYFTSESPADYPQITAAQRPVWSQAFSLLSDHLQSAPLPAAEEEEEEPADETKANLSSDTGGEEEKGEGTWLAMTEEEWSWLQARKSGGAWAPPDDFAVLDARRRPSSKAS
jgi:hypothetical protein